MTATLGSQLVMQDFVFREGQSMRSGRHESRVIPAARVVMSRQPVFISDQIETATAHVELEREGDRIAGLKVTCACGRVIAAECDYVTDGSH